MIFYRKFSNAIKLFQTYIHRLFIAILAQPNPPGLTLRGLSISVKPTFQARPGPERLG